MKTTSVGRIALNAMGACAGHSAGGRANGPGVPGVTKKNSDSNRHGENPEGYQNAAA